MDKSVFSSVNRRRGSISAEHGIGQQKSHLLATARSDTEMRVMSLLKKALDPDNIMNPGSRVILCVAVASDLSTLSGMPSSDDCVQKVPE